MLLLVKENIFSNNKIITIHLIFLQVIYPSEQRRVIYRYNNLGKRSEILFDQTLIQMTYDSGIMLLSQAALTSNGFQMTLTFDYVSSLLKETKVVFPQDWQKEKLVGATVQLKYDNHFR